MPSDKPFLPVTAESAARRERNLIAGGTPILRHDGRERWSVRLFAAQTVTQSVRDADGG